MIFEINRDKMWRNMSIFLKERSQSIAKKMQLLNSKIGQYYWRQYSENTKYEICSYETFLIRLQYFLNICGI